jgi:hypothetical protein
VLRKFSDILPKDILRKLYLSLCYPHIIYCIEVWGFSSKTKIDRVRNIMNRCVRLISVNSSNGLQTYKIMNILTLDQNLEYFTLLRFYKYYFSNAFINFKSNLFFLSVDHSYETRFSQNSELIIPPIHSSKVFHSFFLIERSNIIMLCLKFKSEQNYFLFKRKLKNKY